jgi:trimeric autotransporter adhesin
MLRKYIAILFVLALASLGLANPCPTEYKPDGVTPKPTKIIGDGTQTILTGNQHWDADTVYLLHGWIYVGDGQFLDSGGVNGTLTIDPGTIIKGYPGAGDTASALIITRESKIFAIGTETCPIVFTALSDNVDDPNDHGTTQADKGLWGSLILLGKAPISTPPENIQQVEGVTPNPRIWYGGHNIEEDPHDNSGVVKYVSLRYGGSILGLNNEINGLTMGGVGDGTVIDYVEAYCNNDDGFEWFGGTVNCKHLINAFCDDDGFDWDQGFSGKGQFLFLIADSISNSDHLFEMDSDDAAFSGVGPFSKATMYNFTAIGRGHGNTAVGGKQDFAMKYKEDTGGHLRNGIVAEYSQWAYEFENKSGSCFGNWNDCDICTHNDSEKRSRCKTSGTGADLWTGYGNPAYAVQDIDNYSILWWNLGKTITKAGEAGDSTLSKLNLEMSTAASLYGGAVWPNQLAGDPGIYYGANFRNHGAHALDPRPSASGPAYTTTHPDAHAEDSWFESTPYIGAFSATDNWADKSWTALHQMGYFKVQCTSCGDANSDGGVDISDAVFLIAYIFSGGSAPSDCNYANGQGDANADGGVDISDAVYLIAYIFSGGPAPHCQ